MTRRRPDELSTDELLADLVGYHDGRWTREPHGFHPDEWDADVARWLATPRGRELRNRAELDPRVPDPDPLYVAGADLDDHGSGPPVVGVALLLGLVVLVVAVLAWRALA